MFTRIPSDVEKFKAFIHKTDDLQVSIDTIGYTIFPRGADGKIDFSNVEARVEVKNQPTFKKWDWTTEESSKWSDAKKKFDELYKSYSKDKNNEAIKAEIDKVIKDLIDFDQALGLTDRVATGQNTPEANMKIFNIRQDVIEIKTPLRTIRIKHEKRIPLNAFEKNLIDKYVAAHERTNEIKVKADELRKTIRLLPKMLEPLWEQYPVMREKADKAQNRVFIPPPTMKGSFSEMVRVYVPTQEEAQKAHDDFIEYSDKYLRQLMKVQSEIAVLEKEAQWAESFFDEEEAGYTDPMFDEIDELMGETWDEGNTNSIDAWSLEDDKEGFQEKAGEAMDGIDNAWEEWCAFVNKFNLLTAVYNNFMNYTNGTVGEETEEEDGEPEVFNLENIIREEDSEEPEDDDDPRTETIKRYKSDLEMKTNTYFDIQDWHVILDHYQQQFDRKNMEMAMKRAMEQHVDDRTLIIRRAGMLSDEHQYQQALELLKKAEAQGPPFPIHFYTIKANIYLQLQSPDLAIPVYRKLIKQEGHAGEWWKKHAYEKLIDIYHDKKDYAECLKLSLDFLKEQPDNEYTIEKVALYYNYTGNSEEAEKVLLNFIKYHPKSAVCHQRLGHIYFERKEYRKAADSYENAFKADREEFYEALKHKGGALMELKNYDDAAICYEQCLLYYKLGTDYHVGAAKAYEKMNMMPQAIYHYRTALSLDPDCKEAIDFLMELNKRKIIS